MYVNELFLHVRLSLSSPGNVTGLEKDVSFSYLLGDIKIKIRPTLKNFFRFLADCFIFSRSLLIFGGCDLKLFFRPYNNYESR